MTFLRSMILGLLCGLAVAVIGSASVRAQEGKGTEKGDNAQATAAAPAEDPAGKDAGHAASADAHATGASTPAVKRSIFGEFWYNFTHNLFKPLLLFFYMGFSIPILRVKFDFPYVVYQALTIYLLIAIGWHGGEELALLPAKSLGGALGFMVV